MPLLPTLKRIGANTVFHLLLNLNKWKIIKDRTVTHGATDRDSRRQDRDSEPGKIPLGAFACHKKKGMPFSAAASFSPRNNGCRLACTRTHVFLPLLLSSSSMPVRAAYVTGGIQPHHPPSRVHIHLPAASNIIIEEYTNMYRYIRSMHTIFLVDIRRAHAHVNHCTHNILPHKNAPTHPHTQAHMHACTNA